jgi:hypothetical protein
MNLKCGCMWIQHNNPNTIVLGMHVGIIATLDRRIVVVILGIPNTKNKGALPSFWWNAFTNIQMLLKCLVSLRAHLWYATLTHGTLDCDSQWHKSQSANCFSPKLKAWIWNHLNNGLTTKQRYGIMHDFLGKKLMQMNF